MHERAATTTTKIIKIKFVMNEFPSFYEEVKKER